MDSTSRLIKRALDLVSATGGLVALGPLFAAIALAIRLDSKGPALFSQKRLGRHGRTFRIYKFRTMCSTASIRIDSSGQVINHPDDSRHTKVGRFLRKFSLDELPQLINVARGEMSLVGPRPDLPEALDFYSLTQRAKLEVRPGMTGLAQVNGRNALDPQAKWDLDAKYARDASLFLDARILVATVFGVVSTKGIYKGK